MRGAFWRALALASGVATSAGAQQPAARAEEQAGEARASEAVSNAVLQQQVNELWTLVRELEARVEGLQRSVEGAPAVGGGGSAGEAVVPGAPVTSSTFVGRVRGVSAGQVQVVDPSGNVYALTVDERTRVFAADGQALAVEALREGQPVQASLESLSGRSHARDIRVLDPAELRRGWDARRQPRW